MIKNLYFGLSRCFLFFTAPLFYILCGLIAGAYFQHGVFWIALFFLLLLSFRPIYDWVDRRLYIPYLSAPLKNEIYDYGIVMGGFSCYDWDRDRIEFNEKADRLIEAVLFYKRGKIRKLLITGDGSISQLHPFKGDSRVEGNPDCLIRFLEALGVERENVILELYARNTWENASLVCEELKKRGDVKASLLMFTSAYHVRRALDSFHAIGLSPDYYAVDCIKSFVPPPLYWFPDLSIICKWQELCHQVLGSWMMKRIKGKNL